METDLKAQIEQTQAELARAQQRVAHLDHQINVLERRKAAMMHRPMDKSIQVWVNTWHDQESQVIGTLKDWLGESYGDGISHCFYEGRDLSFTVPLADQGVPEGATIYYRCFSDAVTDDLDRDIEMERQRSMRSMNS